MSLSRPAEGYGPRPAEGYGPRRGLVPPPLSLMDAEGNFDMRGGLAVKAPPPCTEVAKALCAWLAAIPGVGHARLGGPPSGGEARIELRLGLAPTAGEEAYSIMLAPGGALIEAATTKGLARGAATLWQLALSEGSVIAACRIEDSPRFPWRGFMLDTARHFFPVETIERFLDLAALHRLSVFHWHLTDDQAWRIDLPSLPELAQAGSRRLDMRYNVPVWKAGSYSPLDVRRVVAFASARGIEVVPEIETPGHVTALLASHPELSCLGASAPGEGAPRFEPADSYGVFEDILCAGNDKVFELLEKAFGDLARIFPAAFVHAGGDEAPKTRWMACPRCAGRMRELGLAEDDHEGLQAWFMAKVAAILERHGKRMVGWDEILDSEGWIPPSAVVMSWRGYSGGERAARRGHGVVMCPQTAACYLDHKHLDRIEEPGQLGVCTVRDSWSFEAVPAGLGGEAAARVMGGQGNLWSELVYFGKQAEYMAFPRLCALSEALWVPAQGRDFGDFKERLAVHLGRLAALGVNHYRGPLE